MRVSKTMIAPIIATIAILVQTVFGIEIGESVQSQIVDVIANVILVATVVYGIIKSHNSTKQKENAD